MKERPLRLAAAATLLLSSTGCALLPHPSRWVEIRPAAAPQASAPAQGRGEYETAVALIDRRDYARALEFLQAARAHKADDVRVLNAFGVVYDKLGRFDLSARYYGQAEALAPDSPIVGHNVAYSAELQHRVQAQTAQLAQLTRQAETPASPPPVSAIMSGAGVVRLQIAPQLAERGQSPALTGHVLVMVNASGLKDGAEASRLALSDRGWSTPRSVTVTAAPQPQTTISYAAASAVAAQALAKTLPVNARLELCRRDCDGIRLVVGRDLARLSTRSSAARPS
jgi:tetratricopeptide (TPR) repeat protein